MDRVEKVDVCSAFFENCLRETGSFSRLDRFEKGAETRSFYWVTGVLWGYLGRLASYLREMMELAEWI